MKATQIVAPGSVVFIDPEEKVEALVTAACIREGKVTYEVVWWSGNDRKECWITEREIYAARDSAKSQVIGFTDRRETPT